MTDRIMHFSLGPVQSFIAEARRTRDFWAGSFILSLLSGHAMACVERHGGRIDFPLVDGDPLYEAICASRNVDEQPPRAKSLQSKTHDTYIGSLPNRFRAIVTDCPESIGQLCREDIDARWQSISSAVCARFFQGWLKENPEFKRATKLIWQRQVSTFWDVTFVVGEDPGDATDGRWLDLRKNWRSHYRVGEPPSDESGDRCRLMGDLEELSGFHRTTDRENQRKFWSCLANSDSSNFDLSPEEPLSAIGAIKRLFPRVGPIPGVMGWQPGGNELNLVHWPSVSYIAALPWLHRVKDIDPALLQLHVTKARQHIPNALGEKRMRMFRLLTAPDVSQFLELDGTLFHQDGIHQIVQEKNAPSQDQTPADRARRLAQNNDKVVCLKRTLRAIEKAIGRADAPEGSTEDSVRPSEFYAVLQMDGDRIGAHLRTAPRTVRQGLSDFTDTVRNMFAPQNNVFDGVLVYAGGDDVLAILATDHAIDAAVKIRRAYHKAFEGACEKNIEEGAEPSSFTLSASIVVAQYKIPLRSVLREAKHYLEDVAKKENGRDSLAVALLKPGGVTADWVSIFRDSDGAWPPEILARLAREGLGNPEDDTYARGFFHGFKGLYERYFYAPEVHRGEAEPLAPEATNGDLILALLTHQYRRQFAAARTTKSVKEFEEILTPFLSVSMTHRRDENGALVQKPFDFDAGLIIRMLESERRT